jgi:hypothetical protein
VKQDYYGNLFPLNPGGIIPSGPDMTGTSVAKAGQGTCTWSRLSQKSMKVQKGLAQKSVEYFYQIVHKAIKWQPTNTTHQLEEN